MMVQNTLVNSDLKTLNLFTGPSVVNSATKLRNRLNETASVNLKMKDSSYGLFLKYSMLGLRICPDTKLRIMTRRI